MRLALLSAFALTFPATSSGCQVAADGPGARIVPALCRDGVALVWQDGPRLLLQRWAADCGAPLGAAVELFRSEALVDEGGGLEDAAEIDAGRYAVAWRARGDVWVAVVDATGEELRRVMANNATAEPSEKRTVRIAAAGAAGYHGFAVSWNIRQPAKQTFDLVASFFAQDGQLAIGEHSLTQAAPCDEPMGSRDAMNRGDPMGLGDLMARNEPVACGDIMCCGEPMARGGAMRCSDPTACSDLVALCAA